MKETLIDTQRQQLEISLELPVSELGTRLAHLIVAGANLKEIKEKTAIDVAEDLRNILEVLEYR